MRAGGSLFTIKLKSDCREQDLSLSGLDPVPLSKIRTRLLASLGSKGKNRNSLACLRNAGSCSRANYCTDFHSTSSLQQHANSLLSCVPMYGLMLGLHNKFYKRDLEYRSTEQLLVMPVNPKSAWRKGQRSRFHIRPGSPTMLECLLNKTTHHLASLVLSTVHI